jgi:hypothetical protein
VELFSNDIFQRGIQKHRRRGQKMKLNNKNYKMVVKKRKLLRK